MAVPLELRAAAEQELRRREAEGIQEFVPRITPKYEAPKHLGRITELFERSLREPVFALISVPPQFGKTETTLHSLAYRMRRKPTDSCAYVSYIASVAEEKSLLCQKYSARAGVHMDRRQQSASHWALEEGGEFFATGIGGPLTSRPISGVLVVDDPFKNREECESLRERDRVEEWLDSTAFPRCHPTTSIIVIHTRWHEDDLIARLQRRQALSGGARFEVINLQAIDEHTGEPLWPEGRPLDFLKQRRLDVKEHNWWSLYMGKPRPRGGELFKGMSGGFYDKLPNRYRIGKGIDLGYTKDTRNDASAAFIIAECDGDIYVVDRAYGNERVATFAQKLKPLDARYPGPWNFLCSGLEAKGVELGESVFDGVVIKSIPTTSDKWQRAQPFANAWNGVIDEQTLEVIAKPRVFLPRNAPWVPHFLEEMGKFTGVSDRYDNQVDAIGGSFWDFKDYGSGRIYVPKPGRNGYRTAASRGLG